MKLLSAASVTAVPDALDVNVAPLFNVRLAPEPGLVVIAMPLPPALIEVRASDWALLNTNDPIVPEAPSLFTRLLPDRLTVPGPDNASTLAVTTPAPLNVAPPATETDAVPEFAFKSPARLRVPALIVVPPVYVFAPDSVSVPEPTLVSAVRAPPFWTAPEKVVEVLSAPVVSPARVGDEFVTLPVPASEPMASACP